MEWDFWGGLLVAGNKGFSDGVEVAVWRSMSDFVPSCVLGHATHATFGFQL